MSAIRMLWNIFQLNASVKHTVMQITAGAANQKVMAGQLAQLLQRAGKPVYNFAKALKQSEIVAKLIQPVQVIGS